MEAFGVSTSVGMFFERLLSVCLFDLFCGGILGHFQKLIKLSSVDLLLVFLRLRVLALTGESSKEHQSTIFISLLILADDLQQMHSRKTLRTKRSCHQSLPSHTLDTTLASQITLKEKPEPQWAIDRLATSYIPDEIVGRDEEKQVIHTFIQDCILNRINSKVLYISGVPGVGKTASTMQILRRLENQYSRKAKFGFINALTLQRPEHVYKLVCGILTGVTENQGKGICNKISAVLAGLKKPHIIVIDEVDFLLTKDQQIFYNLFEWVAHGTSKLGLVIIANTMDFPERLSGKVNSRMGNHRLVFKPYSYEQIKQIIDERLEGCKYFAANALTFISKKLASFSSDMRTILEILHKAVSQHIQAQKKGKISIDVIHQLWQQKMASNSGQLQSSLHTVIIDLLRRHKGQANSLTLLQVLSQKGLTQASLMVLLKELEEQGCVTLKDSRQGMFKCYNVRLHRKFAQV